ncbi:hypothetical protein JYT51_02220 [Candidatus Amoebophilus asiaticus]|nr:hypothetical protein [Candidatus Amoebophilus asiaticus]
MDNLEKYIQENSEKFNSREPDPQHFERFQSRINENRKFRFSILIKIAASVIIALSVSLYYYNSLDDRLLTHEKNELTLGDISPDLEEVENYYSIIVSNKLAEAEMLEVSDKVQYNYIIEQLALLENDYELLKKELAVNYADERIINSMIQNYRIRIRLIEQYLKMIINKTKPKNHENIQI